jgi:hypothetical protein
MRIFAVDPGEKQSAWVMLDDAGAIESHGKESNRAVMRLVRYEAEKPLATTFAGEFPQARGMPASNQLFTTILWLGRFVQRWEEYEGSGIDPLLINRADVKLHHCGSARAKDSNIRAAIIDRYGGKDSAIGRKKTPGPLYGIKADEWQALAIALMVADCRNKPEWCKVREVPE